MTKRMSISISDYVYDSYLSEVTDNRSAWIEKLIVLGSESVMNHEPSLKQRTFQLMQQNEVAKKEIQNLKLQIENLKKKYSKNHKSDAWKRNEAIKKSGIMREYA